MKKIFLFIFCLAYFVTAMQAQIVNIPDAKFKAALIKHGVDKNNDGEIQQSEAGRVDSLYLKDNSIENLTGIESFTNLKYLDCSVNKISSLDISKNKALKYFECSANKLTELCIIKNSALSHLNCTFNPDLKKICVLRSQLNQVTAKKEDWKKDKSASWSLDCK